MESESESDADTYMIDLKDESDDEGTAFSDSSSCITSVSDISIYHEFDTVIAELHDLCVTHHDALEGLHRLQGKLPLEAALVVYDETSDDMVELDTVIDRLHQEAMGAIEAGTDFPFTDRLLVWMDQI